MLNKLTGTSPAVAVPPLAGAGPSFPAFTGTPFPAFTGTPFPAFHGPSFPTGLPVPAHVAAPVIPQHVSGTAALSARERQQMLRAAGYDVTVDGIAGPQTNTAWNAYTRGTPAHYWNHAWANSHNPAAVSPAATDASSSGAAAPADVTRTTAAATTTGQRAMPTVLEQLLQRALTPYTPPTPAEMLAQAREIAAAGIAPQRAELLGQQNQAMADAHRNAEFEANLGAALGNLLKGQGPATADAYKQAGDEGAAYAKGFSGDLQTTAEKSAADVNALLTSLGAPAGQMLDTGQAADAANVLYGLGGAIPSTSLAREGAAFTAAANQQPATAIGLGLQNSRDALQAGTDEKAKLAAELSRLETQRPGLVSSALSQLQTNAVQTAGLDQNNKLLGFTIAKDYENNFPGVSPFTGKPTVVQAKLSASVALNKTRFAIAKQNADASTIRAITGAKKAQLDAQRNPGGIAAKDWNKLYKSADEFMAARFTGVAPVHNAQGDVTKPGIPPEDYETAVQHLMAAYPSITREKAEQIAGSYWLPGEGGRPEAVVKSNGPLGVTGVT